VALVIALHALSLYQLGIKLDIARAVGSDVRYQLNEAGKAFGANGETSEKIKDAVEELAKVVRTERWMWEVFLQGQINIEIKIARLRAEGEEVEMFVSRLFV
jgi:hypothetical protein